MWLVWKRDKLGEKRPVVDLMCKTKREADRHAKYENKWRGIYGFEFTVEKSPINLVFN